MSTPTNGLTLTPTVAALLEAELTRLEREEHIRILYACESGSRAWGFASGDSDYDVRFIYVRPLKWYVSLERKRDVIERMLPGALALSGWDIRKALPLFAKSNPPMLEWLYSPIVYRDERDFIVRLKSLLTAYYSPRACMYHYLNMAKRNHREYFRGETVWLKKYLYVLRPVLACRWLAAGNGLVPMEMQMLVDTLLSGEERAATDLLLERKRAGDELATGPRITVLDALIEVALTDLENSPKRFERRRADMLLLDAFFRECINRYAPAFP